MRTSKSFSGRKLPQGSLVSLFQSMSAQCLGYLRAHSEGRQTEIAKEVGITRECVSRYIAGHRAPADIYTLQSLHNWMVRDQKGNGS